MVCCAAGHQWACLAVAHRPGLLRAACHSRGRVTAWAWFCSGVLGTGGHAWQLCPCQTPGLLPAAMRAEPAVAVQAVAHLRTRALACPAAISLLVAIGAFRGFKETRWGLCIRWRATGCGKAAPWYI